MSKKLLTITMMILIFAFSNIMANIQSKNRVKLESEIQNLLKGNYLHKRTSLQDNQTWLSIELKGKTWRNPNDTKSLVDAVLAKVKNNMPLNKEARMFKVYIDEPKSGFPIAEITITNNNIEPVKYTYNEYHQKGKEKIYGSSNKKQTKTRYVNYGRPIMSMWSGVKLYYGAGNQKKYVGKIICFDGDYVRVKYPNGNEEYKDRSAIINLKGNWYIDKNDPALKEMSYYNCR